MRFVCSVPLVSVPPTQEARMFLSTRWIAIGTDRLTKLQEVTDMISTVACKIDMLLMYVSGRITQIILILGAGWW